MSEPKSNPFDFSSINAFLSGNGLWIKGNPCVSPDFCLDWNRFKEDISGSSNLREHAKSMFATVHGDWVLVEDEWGDHDATGNQEMRKAGAAHRKF